ncbi:MAG: hypothetical protein E6G68_06780 [Actinobacteria bacterium]|nr:MAG: hypothetical protein E6G68_06780 [Actinomycetota bacterium]
MDHVVVRRVEHLTGSGNAPRLSYAIETRDRKGPAHKAGAFERDVVHVQLHGGLFVARATVKISWIGEYSRIDEVRARTRGAPIHEIDDFWQGRPRVGYAAVAELVQEHWLPAPFWAGPRTYGYEWVVLDDDAKRRSWLDPKEPPRGGEGVKAAFDAWLRARSRG